MTKDDLDLHLSIIEAMATAINFEATLLVVGAIMGETVNIGELSATLRAAAAKILQSAAELRKKADG